MELKNSVWLFEEYIRKFVQKAGARGVVLGLSGGLDSAVTAALCAKALGPEHVLALILPYKSSSKKDQEDAGTVIKTLGIEGMTISITASVDGYFENIDDDPSWLRIGNKAARERMAILYDQAQNREYLVAGTSNKTEWLLGYFTLWGDMAAAFEPLGDLYKTQVRELGRLLAVPESILEKPPTADLWPGQTDEAEIGVPYDLIDTILYAYVEKGLSQQEIMDMGLPQQEIHTVVKMMKQTAFKRRLPHVFTVQHILQPMNASV